MEPEAAVRRFGESTALAVLVPAALVEPPRDIWVVVDKRYPWSLPRLYLRDPPNSISFPHVEASGHLCLHGSDVAFEVPVTFAHLSELIRFADEVLRDGRTGANAEDYLVEAPSYWTTAGLLGNTILLAEGVAGSATMQSTRIGENFLVASTDKQLQDWCRNLRCELEHREPALHVELTAPLYPARYPSTLADLFRMIDQSGATDLLNHCLGSWGEKGAIPVVLSFFHAGRRVLLGTSIPRPGHLQMSGTRKVGLPGFPHGRGHAKAKRDSLSKYPGGLARLAVTPVSRSDLLIRTTGRVSGAVSDARVAIAGCGAIGAPLAQLLLQAGVGCLELIDADKLDWRNIGRHALDARFVGQNKAAALARASLMRFPGASVNAHEVTWERLLETDRRKLEGCDLVVSCTANAASNMHLDHLVAAGDLPSAIFAWVEPFAFAGHAVWRPSDGEGLTLVLSTDGTMRSPVVDRQTAPAPEIEPACGARYQPFSSLNAMHTVAMAGELTIDALEGRAPSSVMRSWIGSSIALHRAGLSLTSEWAARVHKHGFDRRYDTLLVRA